MQTGGSGVTRLEKRDFIDKFSGTCASYPCMVLVRQVGLSADLVAQLRRKARSEEVSFQVVKNSLARKALQGAALGVADEFSGPVGVFFSENPVAIAKIIEDFTKKREDKFFPLAGVLSGNVLTSSDIKRLASLPTLEALRAQLLGLINAPARNLLLTIKEPSACMARVLSSYVQKH